MTVYETLSLLITSSMLLIALLTYIDRNHKHKESPPLYLTSAGGDFSHREVNHNVGGYSFNCFYDNIFTEFVKMFFIASPSI